MGTRLRHLHISPAVYVEIVMINPVRKLRKRKTTTLKSGTLCPVYNEAMAFDTTYMNLPDIRFQVYVKQEMESEADIVLGRVGLGMNAQGLELQHWKETMTSKKPIAHWHSLHEFHPLTKPIAELKSNLRSSPPPRQITRFFSTSSEDEA